MLGSPAACRLLPQVLSFASAKLSGFGQSLQMLQASAAAKAFLISEFGPGAVSLGTVGTERAWFMSVLENVSPSSVWGSPAYLQYRTVVSWKRQVLIGLRRESVSLATDPRHQELVETLNAEHWDREPLIVSSSTPVSVGVGDINIGFDDFLQVYRPGRYPLDW